MMTNALIVTFVCACIAFMALALGFLVQRWVTTIDKSLEKLNDTITAAMHEMVNQKSRLDGHDRDHEEHTKDHDELVKQFRAFYEGQHTPENCPYLDISSPHRRKAPRAPGGDL